MIIKILHKKNFGMTLTELLVSSVLVGVIIMGALSADYSIRTWQKRIEQRTLVQMELTRVMEQILKDGKKAQGNNVCTYLNSNPSDTCYINHATDGTVALIIDPDYYLPNDHVLAFSIDPDINVANDEMMIFYTAKDTGANFYKLYRTVYVRDNGVIIQQEVKEIVTLTCHDFIDIDVDASGFVSNIILTLQIRPDPSNPANSLTNPDYTLTTSFFPPGVTQ